MTLDALQKVRGEANAAAPQGEGGYKLSVNDFVIKALALALKKVPAANAIWAQDRILRFARAVSIARWLDAEGAEKLVMDGIARYNPYTDD